MSTGQKIDDSMPCHERGATVSPVARLWLDESRIIVDSDGTFEANFACAREAIVGQALEQIFNPRDRLGIADYYAALSAYKTGVLDVLIGLRLVNSEKYTRLRMIREGAGWVAYIDNLSAPGDTVYRLLDRQARWSAVVQHSTDGIAILDPEANVVEHNARLLELLHFRSPRGATLNEEYITGKPFFGLLDGIAFDAVERAFFAEKPRMRNYSGKCTYAGKALHINMAPLLSANHDYIGCSVVIRDRSSEAQLLEAHDAAQAATRAKTQFLAHMSHELRTPLNAILGFSQLSLREPDIGSGLKENLNFIRSSGEHLLELINDLLEMSKIEAGHVKLVEAPFDLHKLLRTLYRMMRPRTKQKGLELNFEIEQNVPVYIKGDARKLRQVLINLLSNAFKFTEQGRIGVKVWRSDACDVLRLFFAVSDTGCGIAKSDRARLFQSFVQTENGELDSEGTGLGLPISRQFVHLMGGKIDIESQRGKGAIFSFSIKTRLAQTDNLKSERRNRRVIGLAPGQTPYRILIVEDKRENRIVLRELLESVGFVVREACDGHEGVALYESWSPHLIWMDMRMPGMDGFEASRRIKSAVSGRNTVIIALTASAFEEQRTAVFAAGCDDFVCKPYREHEIFDKMARHLGVRYCYEELQKKESVDIHLIDTEELNALPEGWLEKLQSAALCADGDEIRSLLNTIESEHPTLAAGISALVDGFQFDRMVALLQN